MAPSLFTFLLLCSLLLLSSCFAKDACDPAKADAGGTCDSAAGGGAGGTCDPAKGTCDSAAGGGAGGTCDPAKGGACADSAAGGGGGGKQPCDPAKADAGGGGGKTPCDSDKAGACADSAAAGGAGSTKCDRAADDVENNPTPPVGNLAADSGQEPLPNQQATPPAEKAEQEKKEKEPLGFHAPPQLDAAVNEPPTKDDLPPTAPPMYKAGFGGTWELHSPDSGVSAMHLMIMPLTNMAIMYDATILGPSKINLTPQQGCRKVVDPAPGEDCWAHAVEYDTNTAQVRPLKLNLDTWCSSGSLTIEGALVGVGGNKDGAKAVRYLSPCVDCEFREYPEVLAEARWYGTQAVLADNRYIVVGGRGSFSFEYMPGEGKKNDKPFFFQFLKDTTDKDENNLYPFIHLSTDGNVFIFANDRSVILNPYTNQIIRELPVLDGGARNYPASGSSVLMPINLAVADKAAPNAYPASVMVCGGAKKEAYAEAAKKNFMPALDDCNTIEITNEAGAWVKEIMPSPRVMGDMLHTPNAQILLINGAKRGASAWEYAEDPNFVPVLYMPAEKKFQELAPTDIARMYHSSSALLIDGKILVAGSNTHDGYKFDVPYPTELRVEKFSPPYLSPDFEPVRPVITEKGTDVKFAYGKIFKVVFTVTEPIARANIMVTLYSPAFTTHGCNMNQRILVLEIKDMVKDPNGYTLSLASPAIPEIAPAGYYMLFVNNGIVPSLGIWVQLK